jgi:small subunit ribosomal protein S3
MGQKVNPTGFRTGITLGWKSRWFAPKSNYGEFLVEDARIRKFLDNRLNRKPPFAAVSAIEIERTREEVKVILKTARPGIVIGPKGSEVDALKNALEDLTNRRVNINIVEINEPDLDAKLIAEGVSEQLKRRSSFRRTIKQRAEGAMQAGAKGIKIQVAGRLGGAEMCRCEDVKMGSVPLHTLEADVDYGFTTCFTTYGAIGVKCWVYRGLFSEQQAAAEARAAGRAAARGGRRPTSRGPSRRPVQTARIESATGGEKQQPTQGVAAVETRPAEPKQDAAGTSAKNAVENNE